jgi:hypothetical protein
MVEIYLPRAWGAEDDDMEARLSRISLGFERPHINIAHYKMLKHSARLKNPVRKKLLGGAADRLHNDGINNVEYELKNITNFYLFTHMFIDVGNPPHEILKFINDPPKRTRL